MQAFEHDLTDMVKNIKFKKYERKKIINDTKRTHLKRYLHSQTKFIFYKFHKLQISDNKPRNANIQKASKITMNYINKEAKEIATKLNIDHKINSIAEQPAFIAIKDHKRNFKTNPSYRLINPTKSEIGRINKHILDNINTQLKDKLQLNQ